MKKELTPGAPGALTDTGRPIMLLLELLGRKQTLRILWELKEGACTFRVLQERCGGISPTILNRRISEMRVADIVTHVEKVGYQLTTEGYVLLKLLRPLGGWSERWALRSQSAEI